MSVTSVSYFTGAGQPAFTTAVSVGAPQYITPPEGVTEFIGVQQKMWQVITAYTPPTLSTVATYFSSTCYLTGDSGFSEVGGGVMEFTREFAKKPSTYYEYMTTAATFPGVSGARLPFTREVTMQVENNFFTVGTGLDYASPDLIPVIAAQTFYYLGWLYDVSNIYLSGSTTPTATSWSSLVTTGGYTYVIKASSLERWRGNIWLRKTQRVIPL